MPKVKTASGKVKSYPYTKAGKTAAIAAKRRRTARLKRASRRRTA